MAESTDNRGRTTPHQVGSRLLFRWYVALPLALLVVLALGFVLLREWRKVEAQAERMTALTLAESDHFSDAEPLLQRALERDPADLAVAKALALGRFGLEAYAEAEAPLTRWTELEPDNARPLEVRMELYARLFLREQALADGMRVLAMEPDNVSVRRKVGWMLLAVGRLDEAHREATLGLSHLPGDPDFRYLLAQILFVQGKPRESADQLDTLLARQPGHLPGLLLRGKLYREMGQPEQAVGPLRKVAAESPDPKDRQAARYLLYQALTQCGRAEEAGQVLQAFQRHLEADRLYTDSEQQFDNQDLGLRAARALLDTGQSEKAVLLLNRLLKRFPDCAAAHQLLADFYEGQGQGALAEKHRQALSTLKGPS